MNSQLFLAPATPRNGAYQYFKQTVLEGIPSELYGDFSDIELEDPIRIWGLTAELETSWKQISRDDWVIFYVDENAYRYAARITGTEENPRLGDVIRSEFLDTQTGRKDRDWTFLLFLDEPVRVEITGEEVADLFDYSNDFPVRFLRVTEERIEALTQEYGTVDQFINQIRTN